MADVTHPDDRKSPAKRQAIMSAAARVFVREGFDRTSVDTVAAEAGVSKRTIYNHFHDKESLFISVIRATLGSVTAEFAEALDETIGESDDLERDFVALARRWVRLFLREDAAALRRLMTAEAAHHPEIFHAWVEAGARRSIGQLVRVLARLAKRGKLAITDPARAAEQLTLLITTPAQNASMFGTVRLTDSQIDDLVIPNVQMFLRAYAPPARRRSADSDSSPRR